ncbi:MAG: T9SS type A sorting domain-containing protein [Aureispira sp.]
MRLLLPILFLSLCSTIACSQNLRLVTAMPSVLSENSGLLFSPQGRLWLHNDSGDSAKLYEIDTFGVVQQSILVNGVQAVDWEDITQDPQGRVYVGDFGNNSNNRQNLAIYRLPSLDSLTGNSTTAETIRFYYPEQTAYPPANTALKYDAEALIYYQDSLYIFTKDRTNPHQGYTWLYRVPADTGYHAAELLDSFNTQQTNVIFEVTGAALSPNGQQLALLGATRLWLFSNFSNGRFFDGNVQVLNFSGISQKEALDFASNSLLYIGNESSLLGAAELRALDLSIILSPKKLPKIAPRIALAPNPAQEQVSIQLELIEAQTVRLQLYSQEGRLVNTWLRESVAAGQQEWQFSIQELPAGIYYVHAWIGNERHLKRLVIQP